MILSYHKIDPRFEWGITWVTPAQFERQMAFLHEWGVEAVPVADWGMNPHRKGAKSAKKDNTGGVKCSAPFASLRCENPKSPIDKPIALGFEDAYASVYEYAWPIMERYGFRGTLFVVAGYVGIENQWDANFGGRRFRHLNWKELKALSAAGWEIGSHTWSHRDLTALTTDEWTRELRDSKRVLEDRIGVSVDTLSYPFGRYDDRVRDAAMEAGYRMGCAFFPRRDDSFTVAQTAIYRMDTMLDFKAKATGNVLSGLERFRGRLINSLAMGTPVMQRLGIVRRET
ncbi:MAG: hypothetical protein DRP97_06690 [Candidatus Latescibacterota bacterium]|nr:MAG: hypothetical protein DRP97_06690 [Candidatus Latescibacterota bacterium]